MSVEDTDLDRKGTKTTEEVVSFDCGDSSATVSVFRSQAHIDVTLEITSQGGGDVSHLVHSSKQVSFCKYDMCTD